MPNVAIAALLSCVVMIGSANAAWAQPNATPSPPASALRTASPLPPGGAAGIKQAQGTDWSGPLLGAAVTGGIFLGLLLLVDSDDSGPVTSTTSQ
jgi:hypothetical protein